jgi:hypothetical protein
MRQAGIRLDRPAAAPATGGGRRAREGWQPPERKVPHGTWSRERVLEALCDWAREMGQAPRQHEWAVAHAREIGLEQGLVRRWIAEYPRWPSNATVVRYFGSWSAGLEAAGLREQRMAPWEMTLPERVATARRMSARGASLAAIARVVRVDPRTVSRYLLARDCPDCGAPVVSPRARRCTRCASWVHPRQWSREDIVHAVRAWARERAAPPTAEEWIPTADRRRRWAREYPRWPATSQVQRAFGSWGAALAAAGFPQEHWDRETIILAMRELAEREGRVPLQSDIQPKRPGLPGYDAIAHRFGSFTEAQRAAGFAPRARQFSAMEVLDALGRWAEQHGRPPTYEDWKRAGEEHPSATTVAKLFGSWSAALLAAGLATPRPRRWGRSEIIDALHTWAAEHGRAPRTSDWTGTDPSGRRPAHLRVQREFGTWAQALRAAGFDARSPRWTRDEVIDALKEWTARHGHPPASTDWQDATAHHPTAQTVAHHFGSWTNAMLAAGLAIKRRYRWQPEEILQAIRDWTRQHGRPPERADWMRSDPRGRHPSTGTVHQYFSSWNAAIQTATTTAG